MRKIRIRIKHYIRAGERPAEGPKQGKLMAPKDTPVVPCTYSKEACEAKHAMLQWILSTAAALLIAVMGYLAHRVDSVATDTTAIKVSIQRIDDRLEQPKIADERPPVFLVSREYKHE